MGQGERDRQTDRQRQSGETEKEKETQRETQRETRQTETQTDRQRWGTHFPIGFARIVDRCVKTVGTLGAGVVS